MMGVSSHGTCEDNVSTPHRHTSLSTHHEMGSFRVDLLFHAMQPERRRPSKIGHEYRVWVPAYLVYLIAR